jgi:hypothetical protein
MPKFTYEDVLKICEDKTIKLVWTKEEFKNKYKNTKTKIDIISSCCHPTTVQLNNIIHQNVGIICKDCVYENFKNDRIGIDCDTHSQEYQIMKSIQSYCIDLNIKLSVENCLVDFSIKPIEIIEDIWLPIQIKTTTYKSDYIYKFSLKNIYKDIVIMIFYIDKDNMHKIWLLNGNDTNVTNISISLKKSIYDVFEIGSANLSSTLRKMYFDDKYHKLSFAKINIPISLSCIQEQEFVQFREKIFPHFQYNYPECNSRVYDLIINKSFKVQDKVLTLNNSYYFTSLSRIHKRSYKLGDNDYYWLFLPDKKGAYIISEEHLYNNKIISNKNETTFISKILFYPYQKNKINKYTWLNEHLYFFDNLDHMKTITTLFDNTNKNKIIDDNYIRIPIKDTYIEVINLVKNIFTKIIKKYDNNTVKIKTTDIAKISRNNDINYVKSIVNNIFKKLLMKTMFMI